MPTELIENLLRKGDKLYTRDLMGGQSVYGEEVICVKGAYFREWVPWRSKLSALIKRDGLPEIPEGDILYLGAAQGTTVSHISDLFPSNNIHAVEFSPTSYRKLASLSRRRKNIIPILEDAFHPERYAPMVGPVRSIYQDVSQKDQVGMFMKNGNMMLGEGGLGILMLKARSVDVTASPDVIYEKARSELIGGGFKVLKTVPLDPFQVDHAAIIIRKSER
ncbi:MAG: fibrillarin-like rRNA/tRNA 2'-O-methyltransferase [Thermoplasmata archaeon]|nr:fibrillarin-like rRNA/tRNA 2'-O-methyltransferase [Thermoplasmata archaeon]